MSADKNTPEKTRLHPRNKNREPYGLSSLIVVVPDLAKYIKPNKHGADSVDFANPEAVKLLNKAILDQYYGVKNWDFPAENLCPPIPGRADYLHHMADLLTQSNFGTLPAADKITVLDVGVGASCIYPILGIAEYGWNFIGSDIDSKSVESAQSIISSNEQLKDKAEIRLQKNPESIFKGIINENEKTDFTMCNPPFHASAEVAEKGNQRKIRNLTGKKTLKTELNFSGVSNELIYAGGEIAFIRNMIAESRDFAQNCYWFSTLVSKESNLKKIYKLLEEAEIFHLKTIPLGTGNKSSRIIAWTFLNKIDQQNWRENRWREK